MQCDNPLRQGLPLPVARMDRADGEAQPDKVDVQEGMLDRQLCLRRVLRKAEERDVLRERLERGLDR